jgi:hypothetical protein
MMRRRPAHEGMRMGSHRHRRRIVEIRPRLVTQHTDVSVVTRTGHFFTACEEDDSNSTLACDFVRTFIVHVVLQ